MNSHRDKEKPKGMEPYTVLKTSRQNRESCGENENEYERTTTVPGRVWRCDGRSSREEKQRKKIYLLFTV